MRVNGNLITKRGQIADLVISYYTSLFKMFSVLQDESLIEEVIPPLMTDEYNMALTKLPTVEDVYIAVMILDKESPLGLDGCSDFFFQKYWKIINDDVFGAVL